jgi:hypothetical protein
MIEDGSMEPQERKLALDAISATLVAFHGDQPLFAPDELAALSDRDAKYALADLQEAVRGMSVVELRYLSSELDRRGLSLTKLVLESVWIISSIARKKAWSEADLILLSASREVLPSDTRKRLTLALDE